MLLLGGFPKNLRMRIHSLFGVYGEDPFSFSEMAMFTKRGKS